MDILVIGYYNGKNLGDDAYRGVMRDFFPGRNLEFVGENVLHTIDLNRYRAIVVGGGDIINDYFYDKVFRFLPTFTGPKIAFSIGIPFPSLIQPKYLESFDHIFTRNLEDVRAIQRVVGSHRAHFIPDLVLNYPSPSLSGDAKSRICVARSSLICGIFLVGNLMKFPTIVDHLARLTAKLSLSYQVVLYSFQIQEDTPISTAVRTLALQQLNQQLRKRNPRVVALLQDGSVQHRIRVDSRAYSASEMIDQMATLSFGVCMRYHAHILCTVAQVPFVSISSTRKTRSYMTQAGLSEYQYNIPLNPYGTPTGSNYDQLLKVCAHTLTDVNSIRTHLRSWLHQCRFLLQSRQASALLTTVKSNSIDRAAILAETCRQLENDSAAAAQFLSQAVLGYPNSPFVWGIEEKLRQSAASIGENFDFLMTQSKINLPAILKDVETFITETGDYHNAARLLSYHLLDYPDSPYVWGMFEKFRGLKENQLSSELAASAQFLIAEGVKLSGFPLRARKDRLPIYADLREYQSYRDAHRGGWYLGCEQLASMNSITPAGLPNGLICDLYIDRTFHWMNSYFRYRGIIPYTSPWCGFIHHTEERGYSEYNTHRLLRNPEFLRSLLQCRALFVLAEPLRKYLEEKLSVLAPHVPVITFSHPIAMPKLKFSFSGYRRNSHPKLLGVGAWMRNPFTLYRLEEVGLQKAVLIGKNMESYLPPSHFQIVSGFENELRESPKSGELDLFRVPVRPISTLSDSGSSTISTKSTDFSSSGSIGNLEEFKALPSGTHAFCASASASRSAILDKSEVSPRIQVDAYRLPRISEPPCRPEDPSDGTDPNRFPEWVKWVARWIEGHGLPVVGYHDGELTIGAEAHHLNAQVQSMIRTVKQIPFQDNAGYDKLLSENIVFLDLIDAAAVNTIIECIVRRTPMVVNRIPGTVALLGEGYPLFYHDPNEIGSILTPAQIRKTTRYLKSLNTKQYTLAYFIHQMKRVITTLA